MQVSLIRHGSTAGNLAHRYVGLTDEELTGDAVLWLKENRDRYPRPDCVFVSPMKRCMQTARLLFPALDPVMLPDLRECDFGEFEYKNHKELDGDPRYQEWIESGGTLPFPGGESREDFIRRCCAAFLEGCRRAAAQGKEHPAFLVHGGTIMAVLDRFSDPHREYFDWQVKNAEGYECSLTFLEGGSCALTQPRPLPLAARTGIEDQFVMKKNKKLQCGYTTGSCAAAAAKAAVTMLLTGIISRRTEILTPRGIRLHLPVQEQTIEFARTGRRQAVKAGCAVRKFAGDDPDATDGLLICASAQRLPDGTGGAEETAGSVNRAENEGGIADRAENGERSVGGDVSVENEGGVAAGRAENGERSVGGAVHVEIEGGAGIGRVTKPGLEQPVGAAAINRVPREMITREVREACGEYGYRGGIRITISVPQGEEAAKKTFNPHIGVLGGISILGTSGIVVPMSEEALIASIRVEMKQKLANGEEYLLITPGNYGADFIRRKELSQSLDAEHSMKCSNYVGETVDMAAELGAKGILFVAHIGKFIKVSGGVMNTHSAHADCRAELMAAQAMRAGAPPDVARRLLDTNTTEEAVDILGREGWLAQTIRETAKRIHFHLQKRCRGEIETEVVLFSNQRGYLGETAGADEMMKKIITGTRTEN